MHATLERPAVGPRFDFLEGPGIPALPRKGAARLDGPAKAQVHRLWRQGVAVEVLAERFGLSRAAVVRATSEVRAQRLLEQKLEFMPHPSFDDPAAEAEILAPMPEGKASAPAPREATEGMPPYLAELYEVPLLTREQEAHLFRKMNYLKSRAAKLREGLDPAKAKPAVLDEIEGLQEEALAVKNQIIRANLRLVVSIAKKYIAPDQGFFELVSDGNMSLIRAVEKFDFARGNKFSTYASWAVMKNFSRLLPGEKKRRERFRTGQEELFESAADLRTGERESEAVREQGMEVVGEMLDFLGERERKVIVRRYGLDGAASQTLEELGRELGVTKERVRQIEARAQQRLRAIAAERGLEPGAA
jgi:RNA polymerase primary sigma factor